MYNSFWIYITRIVILILATISGEVSNENFWLRFALIFVAFMLFDVHDSFSAKKDNDIKPEPKIEKTQDN